ncbi:MAG TPA: TRAP transporter large permease subunit, partial [Usitatibacter sp.]|nr:TRAP transporter large permease subunit [Usitatibacter sp.]
PLIGPVADKLGIDLIWFGVLLGVNMQTSFMHPPFGFALFYLRSVAPAREYIDKATGKRTAPVTSAQIYWGAIPFVIIQVIMVGLLIVFPQMSLVYKAGQPVIDINKVKIEIPEEQPSAPAGEDLMKELGGKPDGTPTEKKESPEDKASDDLMKQLQGK